MTAARTLPGALVRLRHDRERTDRRNRQRYGDSDAHGRWDTLKVKITPSANTSEFFFNGASIGVLDHGQTGAGDVIGRLKFERANNSAAAGQYVYLDDLVIAKR